MPYIYPPAQGTLSGDIYSASRFLAQPTLVQRALRTIAQQRFIADAILSHSASSSEDMTDSPGTPEAAT